MARSGRDGKTAKAHVEALERLGKRQVKAPKLYLSDPGLLTGLVGADERRLIDDDAFAGALFETFVAAELERQASWSPEALTFWHYREGEREVDVVVERPSGEVAGIEVKASATVRPRDFSGLIHMRERIGDRLAAGVVLYAGSQALPFRDGFWALPLSTLWDG